MFHIVIHLKRQILFHIFYSLLVTKSLGSYLPRTGMRWYKLTCVGIFEMIASDANREITRYVS
jgi:hypothetical protein